MTSATLIYSPHLYEIPPQKNGVKHPSYTTLLFFDYYDYVYDDDYFCYCHCLYHYYYENGMTSFAYCHYKI